MILWERLRPFEERPLRPDFGRAFQVSVYVAPLVKERGFARWTIATPTDDVRGFAATGEKD